MLTKIDLKNKNHLIYTGAFDLTENKITIPISLKEKDLLINIKTAISSNNTTCELLTIKELQYICKTSEIKSIIYPNGNISFRRLESSTSELKTCYLSLFKNKYIVCIAFDETQPTLYKAELLNVYKITT